MPGGPDRAAPPSAIVLDTNVVLDAFLFDDAATQSLREALQSGALCWIATLPMRDELARVLCYPKMVSNLERRHIDASAVLAPFDLHARLVDVAARASVTCSDPDDQKFIDLAVAYGCPLLSRDQAVLGMKKRLALLGVAATPRFD